VTVRSKRQPRAAAPAPADKTADDRVIFEVNDRLQLIVAGDLRAALPVAIAVAEACADRTTVAGAKQALRDIGLTVWVTARDVMRARGCSRRAAYRYLSEARNGRPGLLPLAEWEAFAHTKWGPSWEDPEAKLPLSAGAQASGTPPSTSAAGPSNEAPANETKPRPPAWLTRGSKRPKLRVTKPRHRPSP
jgi:hypothetical protein